jgi:hypothetical protein
MDLAQSLRAALGEDRVRRDAPLAPFTTFRIGGPADLLAEVRSAAEARQVLRLAREADVRLTWLGGGSTAWSATRASAAWWCDGTADASRWSPAPGSAPRPGPR